jgi:hypothetical protein
VIYLGMFINLLTSRVNKFRDFYIRNSSQLALIKIFKKLIKFRPSITIKLEKAIENLDWHGLEVRRIHLAPASYFEIRDQTGSLLEFRSYPPVNEYEVDNVLVDTTSGVVFQNHPNVRAFFESAPFSIGTLPESIHPRKERKLISGTFVVLSNRSYFHWLIDDLPRFLLAYERSSQKNVIVHPTPRKYVRNVLEVLGPTQIMYKSIALIEQVRFISAGCIDPFPRLTDVQRLKDFSKMFDLSPLSPTAAKIFVSRRFGPSRNKLEEYFEELAKESDFQVVHLENASLQEQIAIFSNASIIVASVGAAFANIVWCQPGCRIYGIYDHNWNDDSPRDLCALLDLNYEKVHFSNTRALFGRLA